MDNLAAIFEIGKNIWEPIGYINSVGENMQNLKRKMLELSSQEEDINAELRNAEHQPGKRRKKVVEVWLGDVQKIKGDVESLDRERHNVFSRPWWQNVFSRPRLGKNIVEKTREVVELHERGKVFDSLVINVLPACRLFIPSAKYFVGATSAKNEKKVWECLMNDEVQKIGVFGMGGAGKTTLMHHMMNNLLVEGTCNFLHVIWATVSKALDIRILQGEIAKVLDLDLSTYDDETTRASVLHKRLSRQERYVLILDDLWEAFPLHKVGIPEPTSSNGCKLVLTTRSLEVCTQMDCRPLKVDLLMEEEALDLFMRMAFVNEIVIAREVREIAIEVAKECKCLPLAIVIVAGSMRGVNSVHEWINALNALTSSTKDVSNGESVLFELFKFSYSRLRDEVLQQCFLYCALYPEDHDISVEELIGYWIAEGLIDVMDSIEAKFDKGHAILGKLTWTCLLESSADADGRNCIRMHDLIRDMALRMTTISPRRFMVKASEGLERLPYEDWSEDLERVSLMSNRIEKLPSRPPICPWLTTLLLKGNHKLAVIPNSFFTKMARLKVLDLSSTGIKSLPESISNLENLHALLLESCKMLENVPSLGKLKALKELNLTCSLIREVPRGIEELVNLQKLDLSFNRYLEMFPSWKLRRLSKLQYLAIDLTRLKVAAKELLCLTQLRVLGAQFHNVEELGRYLTYQYCQGLEQYRLRVGPDDLACGHYGLYFGYIMVKRVAISIESELSKSGVDLLVLPSSIETFQLEGCHDLISLSAIPSLRDARDLWTCEVRNCNGMEFIFSSSSSSEDGQIPLTVKTLHLSYLPSCRVLFDRIVPPHTVSFNLTRLEAMKCPSMKYIFPAQLVQNFPNLEVLYVCDCEHMEHIIEKVETNDWGHRQESNAITLPKLRLLCLFELPRLESIYKGTMVCESVEEIWVNKCSMLTRLSISLHMDGEQRVTAPPALKEICGEEGWWESLEWDDPQTKAILQPLFNRAYYGSHSEEDDSAEDEE